MRGLVNCRVFWLFKGQQEFLRHFITFKKRMLNLNFENNLEIVEEQEFFDLRSFLTSFTSL